MKRLRFKNFMCERSDLSDDGGETLLSVSEYYGVKPRKEAFDGAEHLSRAESLEGYRRVKNGDLVMNYMLAWKGAYGVSDHDGIVSPAYAVFSIDTRVADLRYIHYRVRSDPSREMFRASSKGIIDSRLRLYPDAFLALPIELPDLSIQKTIADFLDRETARIDQLIDGKRRLVMLLKDKQSGVITHLTTLGLDPSVTLKDSGVEWFGPVPAHWVVCHFLRLIESRVDYRGRTPEKVAEGVFLVTARNIRDGVIDYNRAQEFTTSEEWAALSGRGKPKIGDVVFTTEAPLGEVANVDREDVAFAQRVIKFRGIPQIDNFFLKYFMMSGPFQHSLELFASGSTAKGIKSERLAHLFGLRPPLDEQRAIVRRIEEKSNSVVSLRRRADASIDRLREFRSALITAAVTGQIDAATWGKRGTTDRRLDNIEAEMAATKPPEREKARA